MASIPVARPRQPSASRLAPYLERIDVTRTYSNFGPLAISLEDRFADHYGLKQGTVVTAANATLGLALALAAQQPAARALCVMPAWTFIASAHAATMAGLVPYFVDVDPSTWALDPDRLANEIKGAPGPIGAVMPVMPFGSPLDVSAWDAFKSRTGIAVVIDAAAGFDSLVPGRVPSVVSLHATKALGTGEGGFVTATDTGVLQAIRMRSNFGFLGSRRAQATAWNAKLSEYHAAVGHASLDEWAATRDDWKKAAEAYRHTLRASARVSLQPGFGSVWIGSTCLLSFSEPVADEVERSLANGGIETRRWWGAGAHDHPATEGFPRTAVPTTDGLARSTLAVPFFRDITKGEITRVGAAVLSAVEASIS